MARLLFLLALLLPAVALAFIAPAPFRPTAAAGSRALIPEVIGMELIDFWAGSG